MLKIFFGKHKDEIYNTEVYYANQSVSKDKPNLEYPKNKSKIPAGYLTGKNIKNIIDAIK